ncbi:hypothetical protein [Pseudomonas amygdali]|uniref:hypothetical protein n=1 Tax=Pseudomonas amygdali TaxID=47877 RepID=UPI0015E1A210|nr:hypothetical protein [Pseudomonas amygdali]
MFSAGGTDFLGALRALMQLITFLAQTAVGQLDYAALIAAGITLMNHCHGMDSLSGQAALTRRGIFLGYVLGLLSDVLAAHIDTGSIEKTDKIVR